MNFGSVIASRGVALEQAPHTDDERFRGHGREVRLGCSATVQRRISDDSADERLLARQVPDPAHLGERLVAAAVGLDEEGAGEFVVPWVEVLWREAPPELRMSGEPVVMAGARIPEMDVSVDDHADAGLSDRAERRRLRCHIEMMCSRMASPARS